MPIFLVDCTFGSVVPVNILRQRLSQTLGISIVIFLTMSRFLSIDLFTDAFVYERILDYLLIFAISISATGFNFFGQ